MFGLDIGTNSIKVVQLEGRAQKYALAAAGIAVVNSGGVMGTDDDLKSTSQIVKKLISDTKINAKQVCLSIPESQAFTRLIKLPYLSDEEVSSAISWQAEPYIPIPIQEASLSHVILERREPGTQNAGGVDVLLVASPKSLIQRYLRVAEFVGIEVVSVETELIAASRAIAPREGTSVIVDIGALATNIAVVKKGQVVVSRSITTAGDTLTRAISNALSVSLEQAESYKKTYGLNASQLEGKVKEILAPVFMAIVEEIKKSIQYYRVEVKAEDDVTLAVVTGGGAGLAEIVPYLSENLGIEVALADPFSGVVMDSAVMKTITSYAPLYSVAVGLAKNI